MIDNLTMINQRMFILVKCIKFLTIPILEISANEDNPCF